MYTPVWKRNFNTHKKSEMKNRSVNFVRYLFVWKFHWFCFSFLFVSLFFFSIEKVIFYRVCLSHWANRIFFVIQTTTVMERDNVKVMHTRSKVVWPIGPTVHIGGWGVEGRILNFFFLLSVNTRNPVSHVTPNEKEKKVERVQTSVTYVALGLEDFLKNYSKTKCAHKKRWFSAWRLRRLYRTGHATFISFFT